MATALKMAGALIALFLWLLTVVAAIGVPVGLLILVWKLIFSFS